jgi:serine/threonine-protein kinase
MTSSSRGVVLDTVIVVSLVTSAFVSAGVVVTIREGFGLERDEEVPEITGLSTEAARGVLDAHGLRLVQRGERHDGAIAAGSTAEQQPGSRSSVPRGTEVTVLLSLGPDSIAVPDVRGLSATPARAADERGSADRGGAPLGW